MWDSRTSGAMLQKANLAYIRMRRCNLVDTDFTNSNLAKADLRGARIDDTIFTGAIVKDAKIPKAEE